MLFEQKYEIIPRYLTAGTKRRKGIRMEHGVKFLVAHDTGNPNSTASGNVRYFENSRNKMSSSAHIFVDDREIIECIPALTGAPEKAWHVLYSVKTDDQLFGYDANDAAIGVEYCYGDRIDADEAYRKYIWTIAYACHMQNIDPGKNVVGHFFLDPQRKTDPVTGLARSRRTYDQLLKDVVEEYRICRGEAVAPELQVDPVQGSVTVATRLNIRQSAPNTRSPIKTVVSPGTVLMYNGITHSGEPVNGNSVWYRDPQGNFFWSGGVKTV